MAFLAHTFNIIYVFLTLWRAVFVERSPKDRKRTVEGSVGVSISKNAGFAVEGADLRREGGKQGLTAAHDKRDQIDAAAVVVVAGVAWAIGRDWHYQENPEMSALFLVISHPIAIGRIAFLVYNLKWVAWLNIVPYRVGRRCVSVVPFTIYAIGVRDTFDIVAFT